MLFAMSLIKWRNRNDLMPTFPNWVDNFFRDDDFFANRWTRELTVPAVNVKETDTAFDLEVAAPGMKKDDFKLEVKEGMLYISAETKMEKEEKENDYTRREFSYSTFERSFWLPENVKSDNIKATYKDGILMITLPKVKVEKKEPSKLIKIA
jgi:HSP20 family protein